jgi:hypothetical protein
MVSDSWIYTGIQSTQAANPIAIAPGHHFEKRQIDCVFLHAHMSTLID